MYNSADRFAVRKGYFGFKQPTAVSAFMIPLETVCSIYPSIGNAETSNGSLFGGSFSGSVSEEYFLGYLSKEKGLYSYSTKFTQQQEKKLNREKTFVVQRHLCCFVAQHCVSNELVAVTFVRLLRKSHSTIFLLMETDVNVTRTYMWRSCDVVR